MTTPSRLVLITAHLDEHRVERLRTISPQLQIEYHSKRAGAEVPDELWHKAEVLYTFPFWMPAANQVPNLRWVHLYSAGADLLLNHPLFERDAIFTTSSGVHAINIAEHCFTMIQAWFHRLPSLISWQRQKIWARLEEQPEEMPQELYGRTIGIVGYGSIGRQVARLAQAYGMRVLAMQQSSDHRDSGFSFPNVGDPEGSIPEAYFRPEQLHVLLRECDVVVVAVPLTPQTRGMFDEKAFAAMKRQAFFVNIARGDVCDEAALIRALSEGIIAGAALDVFSREPLPAESPLWSMPNVLLSPHSSGLTPRYDERAADIFEANLRRYVAGTRLYNRVEKERGY
ncbi:D-2-hydroxyacid dehydrogenase [Ktedonosporobacter rubrisoli]|uniref:D-2-hydroxyacid dehydrogenase n=1 Tax=Ktedonosporobacter rubrisoli TaxID=2509675 RepID=A0A4P6K4U2_KTERU|nr:D-2-hydroxyacid dehydrogenase [Ktedonosporobacter rubrisoli]QBD83234.1 D-2-hydroxyacid dehydrogenase [Ktedonosporobacter rubrisoli]